MIKYLGSKRVLLPRIRAAVAAIPNVRTVLDLFSGTSRVGRALREDGYFVYANDYLAFAATLARCYVESGPQVGEEAAPILAELSRLEPQPGYFTETFCQEARFFHPKNGARVDVMRDAIAAMDVKPQLEAVLLTSLMEAADRVDSTTGVQMAYLKKYAKRAQNDLELRIPELVSGAGKALHGDAREAAAQHSVDVAYLDPPYNQHSYLGNYHIWETLVRWDKPEAYGVARKRIQCREVRSDFNSKRKIREALQDVLENLRATHLIVSFSNEGYLERDELLELLAPHGHVETAEVDYKRYVGAQIGIHNPSGERVGKVSHLRNRELFFIVSPDPAAARAARDAVESAG